MDRQNRHKPRTKDGFLHKAWQHSTCTQHNTQCHPGIVFLRFSIGIPLFPPQMFRCFSRCIPIRHQQVVRRGNDTHLHQIVPKIGLVCAFDLPKLKHVFIHPKCFLVCCRLLKHESLGMFDDRRIPAWNLDSPRPESRPPWSGCISAPVTWAASRRPRSAAPRQIVAVRTDPGRRNGSRCWTKEVPKHHPRLGPCLGRPRVSMLAGPRSRRPETTPPTRRWR